MLGWAGRWCGAESQASAIRAHCGTGRAGFREAHRTPLPPLAPRCFVVSVLPYTIPMWHCGREIAGAPLSYGSLLRCHNAVGSLAIVLGSDTGWSQDQFSPTRDGKEGAASTAATDSSVPSPPSIDRGQRGQRWQWAHLQRAPEETGESHRAPSRTWAHDLTASTD